MIIITGGAGFIGSNLVKSLNDQGRNDILVVDDLQEGVKFQNLADCEIYDYMDKDDFLARIERRENFSHKVDAVFHEGACSSTTEWDGRYMMKNNYEYSKALFHYCLQFRIPYLYASSASVYGDGTVFSESREYEKPLNVYGYSKFLFDQYVRRILPEAHSPVVGFRYFNVYGQREQHKGTMSSVAFHCRQQIQTEGKARLFEGCDGYGHGEQRRDFIHISDVCKVNFWCLDQGVSGIFNLGTGRSQPFNDVARAVIQHYQRGKIEYIPFPEHLKGRYQSFTEANIAALRQVGYEAAFKTVEEGVAEYMTWLDDA